MSGNDHARLAADQSQEPFMRLPVLRNLFWQHQTTHDLGFNPWNERAALSAMPTLFIPMSLLRHVIMLSCAGAVLRLHAAQMAYPGADWKEAPPESQQVDAVKLAAAVEYLKGQAGGDGVRELVIIRRGLLIWKGDNIDKVHGVWSATKSFTSTALGLLIEDGKCTLDTRAAAIHPELAAHYPGVTLRHFTTMTSGYRAVGDEPRGSYRHGPSGTPFQPDVQPLFTPPGSQYAYWDSAMNEFALVLTRVAGEPLEALFQRRIADPIGMNPKQWRWGEYAKDKDIVVNGGSGNGNKHIFISARAMARLGHLFLNHGTWNGRQLISSNWVRQAASVQVPATLPWAQPESGIDGRGGYGFNWWANGIKADGRRVWPGAPLGMFAAAGHNNNRCFVIPEWQMVVVRLGLDESERKIADAHWGEFFRLIREAVGHGAP
jgi:CubicO group peptidase (beta-lactamase class C family)